MKNDYTLEWVNFPAFVEKIDNTEKALVVQTQTSMVNETLRQFLDRTWEYVKKSDDTIKGFYLYDVQSVGPAVNSTTDTSLHVRYVVKRGELVDGYKMKL